MHTTIKLQCHECETKMSVGDEFAGEVITCPKCTAPNLVSESEALVPIRPQPLATGIIHEPPRGMARRRKRRRPLATPIEMRLPGQLGGLKANVDQKTSNAMATTFLGGLLVALGAFLFAGFMGKGKAS